MNKTTRVPRPVVLASTLIALATACSGNSDPSSSGGSGTIVGDGKPFVPDDIEYVLVDGGRAVTLLSATLVDKSVDGLYWVVAVRNDETVPICSVEINAAFPSAMDVERSNLGGEAVVPVQGAMHDTKDLGAVPCLEPGEIGMGVQNVYPHNPGDPKPVKVDYQPRGYLEPEATKIVGLTVENVKIAGTAASANITGSFANHGAASAPAPEVYVFTLDAGSRPFDYGYARSAADLAAESSWNFQLTMPGPVNKYVTFPIYGQQN